MIGTDLGSMSYPFITFTQFLVRQIQVPGNSY